MLRCLAPLLASLAWACQINGTLFEERFEPECGATDTTRACLCADDRHGIAECFGPGDSGPCDCIGEPPGGGVIELAAGGLHTCALLNDGSVTCWGDNTEGQLGDGKRIESFQPTATRIEPNVEQIALGGDDLAGHGCALLQDGTLQCWGQNLLGQLGDGSVEGSPTPVTPELEGLVQIAAGATHTCAVTRSGQALCWGDNAENQLGYATPLDPRSVAPMPVDGELELVHIALGRYHTCAIDGSGDVWCWGEGENGQLGDDGDRSQPEPVRVEGLSNVKELALGAEHSCALDADRQVHCWGRNHQGQLGSDGPQLRRTPARVEDLPETEAIATGWHHTCALDRGGGVRCWGDNSDGQLGGTSLRNSAVPVAAKDLAEARSIAAGVHSTCATLENGGAKCWGDNRTGQLGDGTDDDRDAPVGVRWLDAPLSRVDAGSM